MPRKKEIAENNYDFLEKKYGVTPGEILKAIKELGPYKARLETFFMVQSNAMKKQNRMQGNFFSEAVTSNV